MEDNLKKNYFDPYPINESMIEELSIKQYIINFFSKNDNSGINHIINMVFLLFGYPSSKNQFNPHKKAQKTFYFCLATNINIYKTTELPSENIILAYSSHGSTAEQLKTKGSDSVPCLKGMSGCGIWYIPDYPSNPKNHMLFGMFTNIKNDELITGFTVQSIIKKIDMLICRVSKNELNSIDFVLPE